MKLRILALSSIAALTFGLAACSSGSSNKTSSGTSADITIHNLAFVTVAVKAGATVTIKNEDSFTHTVTADDASFNMSVDGGKTATIVAPSKPGTYKFHCNIHAAMHGTLTVT